MIEKNRRIRATCNCLADAVLIFLAYLLANYLRFNYMRFFQPGGAGPALAIAQDVRTMLAGVFAAVGTVLVLWLLHLYDSRRLYGIWRQSRIIVVVNALCIVVFQAVLYLARLPDFSRMVLALFYCLACGLLIGRRLVMRWYHRRQRDRGEGVRHLLMIGGGAIAAKYLLALQHNPYYGFQVDGYLAGQENPALACRYLGGYDRMDESMDDPLIEEVIIAVDAGDMDRIPAVLSACDKHGTRVTMVPFYNDYLPVRPTIDVLDDCKLINIRQTPFDNLVNAAVKRLLDIVGSMLLIILTSPVMLAVAIGVKLSSPGPVLFRQERIGLNKKPFMMYKFRSMRVNTEENTAWSTNADPRKTRFGSLIRKFSLDELPQFFNVLKGDMSLVGPRPEIPFHVEHFKEEIPRYLVRQQVRPGCTGWAQVNGLRGDTDIAERIRYDIWYIENWTVALDLKIIFRTVFGGKMINDEKLK